MIINGKERELNSYLDDNDIKDKKIKIKLKVINKMIDISYMLCFMDVYH